jgi:hypothetical protein
MSFDSIARLSRRFRAWMPPALVLVVIAIVALAATGGAGSSGMPTPDAKLLRTHQPVLVLHPNEQFRPTKIQPFVADSELERFVGTSPAQLPLDAFWTVVDSDPEPGELPAPAPGVFYRLDQTDCEADAALAGGDCYAAAYQRHGGGAAVYGRVVHTDTRIVLQYWLFYYDNPLLLPPTPVGTFWQSHEGDWEVVNVVLDTNEQPLEAAYSQHCSGERKAWDDVEKSPANSTHPVAYVALGSHANYFAPGPSPLGGIPINPACIPSAIAPILPLLPFLQVVDQVLDGSGVGNVVGPPGSGVQPAVITGIEGKAWSVFGGRWGESEYFFTPIPLGPIPAGAVPVGLAPASPANQQHWNVATVLGWPVA